jgi:short-subunit dehydrogenase
MARFQRPAAGSVAIVTGASSGLGRALALSLARRGHIVLAVARRADRLVELQTASLSAAGAGGKSGRIESLALDVTAPDAPDRIYEAARRLGEIGWLVNNAGAVTFGRLEEAKVEEQRALVRLNAEAVVTLTTRVLPDLVHAGRGIVLQVASSAGLQPTPGWAVYGATKAFVIAFAEGISEELRGSGVSVTAMCPGPVTTEIFSASVGHAAADERKRGPWELTPEACAEAGLQAALAGRTVAVIGATNKLLALSGRLAPRALLRRISALISLRYIGLPPMPPRRPS